jgi:hypothetical protein
MRVSDSEIGDMSHSSFREGDAMLLPHYSPGYDATHPAQPYSGRPTISYPGRSGMGVLRVRHDLLWRASACCPGQALGEAHQKGNFGRCVIR